MIIIKTSNGSVLVNEVEIRKLQHFSSHEAVCLWIKGGPDETIYDVESVEVTEPGKPWSEEGPQIAHLHSLVASMDHLMYYLDRYSMQARDAAQEFASWIQNIEQALIAGNIPEATTSATRYRENAQAILKGLEGMGDSIQQAREKMKSIAQEQVEMDSQQARTRYSQMEKYKHDNARLEDAIIELETKIEKLRSRNLWQRILNK